jgi:23S rRNA-intervening sequence protein
MVTMTAELPIIQKTYDLIKWYIPHLNKLPREHKFILGDRMARGLYGLLDALVKAQFIRNKGEQLQAINSELDILRYQTRLLYDFNLLPVRQYEFVSKAMNEIGSDLGGWIKQQARIT